MNISGAAKAISIVITAIVLYAQDSVIPPVPDPAAGHNPPCGSNEIPQFYQRAIDLAAEETGGVLSSDDIRSVARLMGFARSYSSNCSVVAKVVDGDSEIWFDFGDRGIKHPYYCEGHRTTIESEYAAVENIQSRRLRNGKYLLIATFKNWSHDLSLEASIQEFSMGYGYDWFPHCGSLSQNTVPH